MIKLKKEQILDPYDINYMEENKHIYIYNIHDKSLFTLYRHFLIMNDGTIIELKVSDKRVKSSFY